MNSRERIIAAIEHKPVDRVPIDFGGTGTTGIHALVYSGAKRMLGLPETRLKVEEVLSQLVRIEPEMQEALGADVSVVWRQSPCLGMPVTGFTDSVLDDGTPCVVPDSFHPVLNEKGALVYQRPGGRDMVHPYLKSVGPDYDKGVPVAICPKGYHSFSRVYHPLSGVDTIEQLQKFAFPDMDDEELAYMQANAKHLYETTDKALCGVFNGNIFELGQLYWGYEEFFVNLLDEEDLIDFYLEYRTDGMMRDLKRYLDALGKYIQVIEFTEDLGTQSSLLISPRTYRERIKPYHRKMFDFIKSYAPNVKILLHSCGAVSELIPDFIEIGADALNPVQISAAGMEPEKLKREFGKDICFWGGGVDTQKTLAKCTPEQVRAEVRKNLDVFAPGSGYIFSQVHNIDAGVPSENLLAAFLTAKEYKL